MIAATTVYLDHNATSPVTAAAKDALVAALDLEGNPSSVHGPGRAARAVADKARRSVAMLAGGDPERTIFTSGGTEANNLALTGTAATKLFVGATEHASVLDVRDDAVRIPVDKDGVIDLVALKDMLAGIEAPFLVSVMWANNETGVVQPICDIAELVHAQGGMLHCDAVQAAGRLPMCSKALGADLVTLSAHKIGGPKGVGALLLAPGISLVPLVRGGGQEKYRRGGTENLPGIAGFRAAADEAGDRLARMKEIAALRDRMETEIKAAHPDVIVAGAGVQRLPNTSCLALPGLAGETQVMKLDLAGFAVSAGSACSSGKVKASHVLQAMGVDWSDCAIRVSLGPQTTGDEIDRFIAAYGRMADRARQKQRANPALSAA